jgi:hypothetical protein
LDGRQLGIPDEKIARVLASGSNSEMLLIAAAALVGGWNVHVFAVLGHGSAR